MSLRPARRHFLRSALGLAGLGLLARPAQAAKLTPAQTEGPFYPTSAMRRGDVDNDLVKVAGAVRRAGGEIVHVTGRVVDRQGVPVRGARVEIWQCDSQGRYMHPGDRRSGGHDPAFQGFGHDITDADGRYDFRTIRSVAYPGRTPHIHVKAIAGGRELTTQFYVAGEPANRNDAIFRRLTEAERQAVLMRFETIDNAPRAELDIVL